MPQVPYDPVAGILAKARTSNTIRADAWDAFHDARDPDDLAERLRGLSLDDAVKADLWDLKSTGGDPRRPASSEEFNPRGRRADGTTFGEKIGNAARILGDVGLGAVKGAASTVANLGEMAANAGVIPGVQPSAFNPALRHPAFAVADERTTAANTPQAIGKGAEQVAEMVIPGRALTAAGKGLSLLQRVGLEAGGNAAMGAAQGGNPLVAGVVGAAIPGAGAIVDRAVPALREAAEKGVMEALGPTKERFKAMSERLTPEILRRGLRGSREQLQEQAAEAASAAGERIDQAIQAFGGRPVDTANITDALESAKNAFRTSVRQPIKDVPKSAAGRVVSIGPDGIAVVAHEFEPRAIRQLEGLQKVITEMGPEMRTDQLIAIRRAWDKVVDQAGGFAHRAGGAIGVPLSDQSEAFAKRAATSAIREQLNATVPELTALNKEFSFWKGLDDVLTQTLRRTQPHGPGLTRTAAEIAGNVVGGAAGMTQGPAGALGGAFALGKVAKLAQSTFQSPRWKLASAQMKDALAEAIASNDAGRISAALARILAVQGSKVAP